MLIYLVNPSSRPYTIEKNPLLETVTLPKNEGEDLNVYIAGGNGKSQILRKMVSNNGTLLGQEFKTLPDDGGDHPVYDLNILESFYYARDNATIERLMPYIGNFLLDSGAFTFMSNTKVERVDWDAYVEDYAKYINTHKVGLFFELDIDSIVGLPEVERLRNKLETLTGRTPIPVWHISRGKDYFTRMCERYPYVSIGGIVTQEIRRDKYETLFPWFISEAHRHGCKIHGLGYTGDLKKYRFDSVDSTAWLYGNRGGYVYKFDAGTGRMSKFDPPKGKRLASARAALYNFNEWVKYCQWAKRNL